MRRKPLASSLAEIKRLHAEGMTDRRIAQAMDLHHRTVAVYRLKLGIQPNGTRARSIEMVDADHARCSCCSLVRDINGFSWGRRSNYPYRLSYCNGCKREKTKKSFNRQPYRLLKDRYNRLKIRADKDGVPFSILFDDFKAIYDAQAGKCFYTDMPMRFEIGCGGSPNSLSVDKVVPSNGGNVVFCITKANLVKNNLSLHEMASWLPDWYARIVRMWRTLGLEVWLVENGQP